MEYSSIGHRAGIYNKQQHTPKKIQSDDLTKDMANRLLSVNDAAFVIGDSSQN
jgi:hypothetical protein